MTETGDLRNVRADGRFIRQPGTLPYGNPDRGDWAEANLPTYLPADLADNITPTTVVPDQDGILRPGDARLSRSTNPAQNFDPVDNNFGDSKTKAARPIILNRLLRSVGEMSYAHRDQPWKTLDFYSDLGADAALLDLFTVTEFPSLVGGKTNLNVAQEETLQAIIAGVERSAFAPSSTVSPNEAFSIAQALAAEIRATPMISLSDLVARTASLPPASFGSSATGDGVVKARREGIIRALAGSGQTRTWNLLVDVVAQKGRFTKTATAANHFIAQGEKRYWLHLAIDRFTGRVIDQQLEPVSE